MLDTILYLVFEGLYFAGHFLPGFDDTKTERKRKAFLAHQRRWLDHWARGESPRKPIPEKGFKCLFCQYPLAGLTEPMCPECGRRLVA